MLTAAERELNVFLCSLQRLKGIDLRSYREQFLQRRLRARMMARQIDSTFAYLDLLKKEPDEYNRFLEALSINVTEFFRDPDVFDFFRKHCLTEIIQRKVALKHENIRIWSAACASGEEAYSLAIMFKEELKEKIDDFRIRIWGTDIDKSALDEAKRAEYSKRSLKEVDSEILKRYFSKTEEDLYRFNAPLKELVHFAEHNLNSDEPLKYMEVVFCRNVMIYLRRKQQQELFLNFYEALNPRGYLVIGKVEGLLGALKELFVPVDLHKKIFQKRR